MLFSTVETYIFAFYIHFFMKFMKNNSKSLKFQEKGFILPFLKQGTVLYEIVYSWIVDRIYPCFIYTHSVVYDCLLYSLASI